MTKKIWGQFFFCEYLFWCYFLLTCCLRIFKLYVTTIKTIRIFGGHLELHVRICFKRGKFTKVWGVLSKTRIKHGMHPFFTVFFLSKKKFEESIPYLILRFQLWFFFGQHERLNKTNFILTHWKTISILIFFTMSKNNKKNHLTFLKRVGKFFIPKLLLWPFFWIERHSIFFFLA